VKPAFWLEKIIKQQNPNNLEEAFKVENCIN